MATAVPPPPCQSVFTYSHSSSAPRHAPGRPSQTLEYVSNTSIDELSSSDKENSTSLGNAVPLKNEQSIIVEDSTKHTAVSFTPRRVKPPPRAWERRPATPFLSRNEGQKIWKRVPLGDLNAEGSTQLQASRRQQEESEDYVRVTKRMRTDMTATSAGDEADWPKYQFLGTKWEEDNIEQSGSPKKKQRIEVKGEGKYHDVKIDLATELEIESKQPVTEDMAVEVKSFSETPQDSDAMVLDAKELSWEHTLPVKEDVTSDTPQDQPESSAVASDTSEEFRDVHSSTPLAGSLIITGDVLTENIDEDEKASKIQQHQNASDVEQNDIAQLPPSIYSETEDDGMIQPTDSGVDVEIQDDGHAQSLSSQQANRAESAVDLSSPLKFSSSPDRHIELVDDAPESVCANGSAGTDTSDIGQSSLLYHGTDHEDTAFLHDFLQRARASKAARETISPIKPAVQSDDIIDDLSATFSIEQEASTSGDDETTVILSPSKMPLAYDSDVAGEEQIPSPVRRSARAAARANTKPYHSQGLPLVPQFGPVLASQNSTLPNTIQLKRATGTEFIFNAKVQQTLAMTTRSNTKRNHSGAMNVTARLAQLRAEQLCRMNGFSVERTDSQDTCDGPMSIVTESPVKNKKHKRSREDAGRKKKKTVKWHEVLASYQEPIPSSSPEKEPTSDEFAAVEAAAQAEALRSMTDSFAIPSSNATTHLSEAEGKAGDQSESSKLKVRKMRKFSVGSVNGTPAPKTRSQRSRPLPTSSRLSMQSGIPKMGSRMPVPVSSSASSLSSSTLLTNASTSEDRATTAPVTAITISDKEQEQKKVKASTSAVENAVVKKPDQSELRKPPLATTGRRVLRGRG